MARSARVAVLAVCLLPLVAGGCQSRPAAVAATPKPPDPENGLKQLGEFYKYLAHEKAAAPGRAADLDEHEEAIPDAKPLIASGEIVVVWGKPYSASSTAVLAYQKEAKTAGGKVLLRNGTVKAMTAAEFEAATKAK